MTSRIGLATICVTILCHTLLLYQSAALYSPTWDEPGHLVAGLSHWEFGRFNLYPVNPPLVRFVAAAPAYWRGKLAVDWTAYNPDPVHRSEVFVGRRFFQQHGQAAMGTLTMARRFGILFSILGAVFIARWAIEVGGINAGVAATFLWCFSPTILGHGALITPDVGAASTFIVAAFYVTRWIRRPSWAAACGMSLAIALAISAKTTNWVILPTAAILWVLHGVLEQAAQSEASRQRQLLQLSAACAVAVLLFNALYGFQGTGTRLRSYAFVSSTLGDTVEGRGNRFHDTQLGMLPIPLPSDFVYGVDIQKRDIERGLRVPGWRSYLRGTWQQGGWYHFYLSAMLLKESFGTIILFVVAVFAAALTGRLLSHWMIWLPAIAIVALVSSQSAFTMHYRYVLPALPFVYLLSGVFVARTSGLAKLMSWGLVACSVIGSLSVYPNSLSHFNLTAAHAGQGEKSLVDSNVDWGQDLLFLKKWLNAHPEAKPLKLAYFGSFDPRDFQISYQIPRPLPDNTRSRPMEAQRQLGPQPGWHAVSVNYKQGCLMPVPNGEGDYRYFGEPVFSYFEEFSPIARIGGSIEIFDLTEEEVNSVRRKLDLPLIE